MTWSSVWVLCVGSHAAKLLQQPHLCLQGTPEMMALFFGIISVTELDCPYYSYQLRAHDFHLKYSKINQDKAITYIVQVGIC